MRKYARTDANQAEIVGFLRAIPGVTVLSLAPVGNGCPDILVGYKKQNWLFELKDPNKPPSARKLTKDQETFHAAWNGQIDVAETFGEILNVMRGKR